MYFDCGGGCDDDSDRWVKHTGLSYTLFPTTSEAIDPYCACCEGHAILDTLRG